MSQSPDFDSFADERKDAELYEYFVGFAAANVIADEPVASDYVRVPITKRIERWAIAGLCIAAVWVILLILGPGEYAAPSPVLDPRPVGNPLKHNVVPPQPPGTTDTDKSEADETETPSGDQNEGHGAPANQGQDKATDKPSQKPENKKAEPKQPEKDKATDDPSGLHFRKG